MVCGRVSNLLSAYLDQELGGHEMLSIQRHLAECPRCGEERDTLMRVRRLFYSLPSVEPPPRGADRLIRRYADDASQPRRSPWWQAPLAAVSFRPRPAARLRGAAGSSPGRTTFLPSRFTWATFGAATGTACLLLIVGLVWGGWQPPQHPDTVLAMVRPGLEFSTPEATWDPRAGVSLPAGMWNADRLDGSPRWPARERRGFEPIRWTPADSSVEMASPGFRQANWEIR